ncbi:hypothetical protein K8R43_01800 [archaeon]|nr:hypothetical protein [archaeon]
MKKIALLLLLLLSLAIADEGNITWNKAASLAKLKYPDLVTQPQSNPAYPVELDQKYWVVEFDDVWIPVAYSNGKILTDEEETIKGAYRIHWIIQQMKTQKTLEKYPTKQKLALIGLVSDVENHERFIETNKEKLPEELKADANTLLYETCDLKASISGTKTKIESLETIEAALDSSSSTSKDVDDWIDTFEDLLNQMGMIATNGRAYDNAEVDFQKAADAFIEESNDSKMINTVEDFSSSLGLLNTGSLPGLNSTANEWKTTFLGVQLSNKTISEHMAALYSRYREIQTEKSILDYQEAAAEELEPLLEKAPSVISRLSSCTIGDQDKRNLDTLKDRYEKAINHWDEGNDAYERLDYDTAEDHYLNVKGFAEEANERLSKLENVQCENGPNPEQKTLIEVLQEFIGSPMGIIVIILVLVLVGLVFWNKRKGEDYYDEYENYPTSLPDY